MPGRISTGILWFCLIGTAAEPTFGDWGQRIEAALQDPAAARGQWGVLVVDRKTDAAVFQHNPDLLLRPASVAMLFTTATALVDLGPEHRFQTPIYRRGEVDKDGVLHGDLILVASGDMSLGGRTGPDGSLLFTDHDHSCGQASHEAELVPVNPLVGIESLVREIGSGSIKAVHGEILIDDRLFPASVLPGANSTVVSPIIINDNLIDIVVTPGAKLGESATIRLVPDSTYMHVDPQVVTGSAESKACIQIESVASRSLAVRGSIPLGHAPEVNEYEIQRPSDFARAVLIEALRRQGIAVTASPLASNPSEVLPPPADFSKLSKVAEYTSPAFREYVRVILKADQRLHASILPHLLATHRHLRTQEQGLVREGEVLRSLGLDLDGVSLNSGPGGGEADLLTPRATVALLRAMASRPECSDFESALPVLGQDGVLSQAVGAESPSRGHVRAMTGAQWVTSGVNGRVVLTSRSLAGYMETASGRPLIFAVFLNNVPVDLPGATDSSCLPTPIGKLFGTICEALYDDSATTSPNPIAPDGGASPVPRS